MKRKVLICWLIAGVLLGCKQVKPTVFDNPEDEETEEEMVDEQTAEEERDDLISEEPMPLAAEELFDDFLFNFASNKHLQVERIHFPLIVKSEAKNDTIGLDEWQMDHFFMHNEEYTLIFNNEQDMELVKDTSVNEAIVEKIFLDQSFVRQYLFSRHQGHWMLNEVHHQTLSHNPNAAFLSFYRQFVTDSTFQKKSLSSEIEFCGSDPDDEMEQMEGVITPDFWDAFAPELPHGTIYNIVYGRHSSDSDERIFVLRGIANGLEVEMTFHCANGHWLLKKLRE
jgi:hypothetical protein